MTSNSHIAREIRVQYATEAINRFQKIVLPRLVAAGFTMTVQEGWKRKWKDMWYELVGNWSFFSLEAKYGDVPCRIEVHRDDITGLAFHCSVCYKEPQGWWNTCWTIRISSEMIVSDNGFSAHKLFGMGPEELPF